MQPFIEIPIGITNVENKSKEVPCRLKPGEIIYYYPGFEDGTVIVLKCGQALFTPLTFSQVDQAIQLYNEFVDKNPGKFGNLQMNLKPQKPTIHAVD